jgi:hypothetical protein
VSNCTFTAKFPGAISKALREKIIYEDIFGTVIVTKGNRVMGYRRRKSGHSATRHSQSVGG